MANNIPFQPMGKTYLANVSTSSVEVAINADSPCNQLRIHNDGQTNAHLRFSATSGNAAAVPAVGTPAYGMAMHPNTVEIFTVPQAFNNTTSTCYVSAISTGAIQLWITPGEGL
jgi:hypothetical protein